MPTIALYTETSSLLCFLLMAGDDPVQAGKNEKDCLLTGFPALATDMEHPLSVARTEYLHVEHTAHVAKIAESLTLRMALADLGKLEIHMTGEKGTWTYKYSDGAKAGTCALAKPKVLD